jgi:ribosomal protein S18 acetylase RimI-like enzyme
LIASRAVSVPSDFHRFWIALAEVTADVRPTSWGAVVTDPGSPDVWDLNHARLDRAGPVTLEDVEDDLLPALRSAGVTVEHVVSMRPDAHGDALTALAARGHRLGWDVLLVASRAVDPGSRIRVEELVAHDELPTVIRDVLREGFAVQPDAAIEQLVRLDRDTLGPAGKRWFGVRDEGARVVSAGTLLVLEGTAYVDDVATLPGSRGRGFASAVVTRIVAEARAAGADRVYLLADPDDPRVVAMYERLGFAEAGRIASTRGPTPAA